jgi:hypothetical protein
VATSVATAPIVLGGGSYPRATVHPVAFRLYEGASSGGRTQLLTVLAYSRVNAPPDIHELGRAVSIGPEWTVVAYAKFLQPSDLQRVVDSVVVTRVT